MYEDVVTDWPLLQRGWVLQERFMSLRIILYVRDQLFWECNSSFLSRNGHCDWNIRQNLAHRQSPLKPGAQFDPHASWRLLIDEYSKFNLTRESDLLPALPGVAKQQMPLRHEDIYVAGLWTNSLLEDLNFYNDHGLRPDSKTPTWSCALGKGPI
jgi:hypothetical protein